MVVSGRKLSNGDMAVAIGALVGFIAVFLPWYSVSTSCSGAASAYCGGFSASTGGLSDFWGWLFMLGALIALVYIALRLFAPATVPALPLQDWMIFLILGAVMAGGALIFFLTTSGGGSSSGFGYSVSAGVSFGWFIGLVAAAAVAVGGFLKKSDPQPATAPLNIQRAPAAPGQPGAAPQAPQYSAPPPAPQPYAAPPVQQAPPVAPPPQAPPPAPPAPSA